MHVDPIELVRLDRRLVEKMGEELADALLRLIREGQEREGWRPPPLPTGERDLLANGLREVFGNAEGDTLMDLLDHRRLFPV